MIRLSTIVITKLSNATKDANTRCKPNPKLMPKLIIPTNATGRIEVSIDKAFT